MKKLYEHYKTFMVEVVLRKILIPVMLGLAYFVGVGISSLLARIFIRKQLNSVQKNDQTWWVESTGNEPDQAKCLRQS